MSERDIFKEACADIRSNLWILQEAALIRVIGWFSALMQDAYTRGRNDRPAMDKAAPDLLAAMEALLRTPEIADCDLRDKDEETHVAERMARAAIAKAKGEAG